MNLFSKTDTQTHKKLSNTIVWLKYADHLQDEKRRENWTEITNRSANMHIKKFPKLITEIRECFDFVEAKEVLQSMRSAQFGGKAIESKNNRVYNCALRNADSVEAIKEIFYNLLCGSGVGYSVQQHHIAQIPKIVESTSDTRKHFTIADTIEGWCEAVGFLFDTYTGKHGAKPHKPRFLYHLIRAEGLPLKTSGGTAPGPEPLRLALKHIETILIRNMGKKLGSLALHDCLCLMADAVHSGGSRRAAMISFFDRDDRDMLTCKSGNWAGRMVGGKWVDGKFEEGYNPQRGRANNSAVFLRGQTTFDQFWDFWEIVQRNGTGEPGIFWTNDRDSLSNPCVEISLHDKQLCNLTTINGATIRTQKDLEQRAIMAARIGTLQASYTDFSYLSKGWQETTEREALLGVSITGIGSGRLKNLDLKKAALAAVAENKRFSKKVGINIAARVTAIKPEGTGSLVLGTPAGIHAWHNDFYWRSIRIGKSGKDGFLYRYLLQTVPELIEDEKGKEATHAVFRIPIKANKEGYFRKTESALDLLERVKRYNQDWISTGHSSGANKHNISCTVSIKDHEWQDVGVWMWENRQFYNGLTVMPYAGGNYQQAPFCDCTEDEFNEFAPLVSKIDISQITEMENNVDFTGELACSGGTCGI